MFGTDWDMFKPFSTPLDCKDPFFIAILVKILCQNDQIWEGRTHYFKSNDYCVLEVIGITFFSVEIMHL